MSFVCTAHWIYHFHFVTYVNFCLLQENIKNVNDPWSGSVSSINLQQRTWTTPINWPFYHETTFKIKTTDMSLDKPKGVDCITDQQLLWPILKMCTMGKNNPTSWHRELVITIKVCWKILLPDPQEFKCYWCPLLYI